MQTYNHVLTSSGFKSTDELNCKDLTFNRSGFHSRISFTQNSAKNNRSLFSKLCFSIDDLSVIIPKDKKVLSFDPQTFEQKFVKVVDLTENHWVFSPWIKREVFSPKHSIDISKYVDNYYDSFSIYLFNNEILEIAEHLEIPLRAVKELLIREAAEYKEHLDTLRLYIYDKYHIVENVSDPETSFINFKKYVLKNHVYKMSRFVEIDQDFISFIIASFTCASTNQSSYNKNNKYVIDYTFDGKDTVLKNALISFLKKVNVKYEVKENLITVKNKPFYMFLVNGLMADSDFLYRLNQDCYDMFTESLFKYNNTVTNISLKVDLQIKHIFLSNKKVVSVRENPLGGYNVTQLQDDFSNLDSTLIVTSSGYYSKLSSTYQPSEIDKSYTYINSEDSEVLFTNCFVRL